MPKIAIISDVHSNIYALDKVLSRIKGMEVFCVGDLVGYNPYPNEVIEMIRDNGIISIMGNHDHAVITGDTLWFNPIAARAIHWTRGVIEDENLEFLKTLPNLYVHEHFTMVHGSPRDPLDEYVYSDYPEETLKGFLKGVSSTLILGHTHVPFVKNLNGKLIFNPGGVGQPRDYDPRASFAIFDTENGEVEIKRVEYEISKVADEILDQGLPKELAYRLYLGY